jgi:hypothetical protein
MLSARTLACRVRNLAQAHKMRSHECARGTHECVRHNTPQSVRHDA